MGKYLLQIAFLFAFGATCLTAQTRQEALKPGDTQFPRIVVASQPDSPLLISTTTRWATPGREILDLYVVVKNQDPKPVRAFTTVIDYGQRNGPLCLIDNIYYPGKILKTGQTDGKSRFIGFEKNVPLPAVRVFVDYVEFTDGSVWGQDSCQAAESLAGERAGGAAAIKWLQALLKEKGTESVIEAIQSCQALVREKGPGAAVEVIQNAGVSVETPYNQSAKWEEAFGRGVGMISGKVMDAFRLEGEAEVEAVLRKPYDASGLKR